MDKLVKISSQNVHINRVTYLTTAIVSFLSQIRRKISSVLIVTIIMSDYLLQEKEADFYEKKMFGGLCFMVDDKMCVGIVKEELMARIGTDAYEDALQIQGAKEMNFTGRAMKGYVFVEEHALESDEGLAHWIQLALNFNPLAKASKKRKKKQIKNR
ncbi:MAG: TfoX/Sxy family transcriptional regulator of competence genes [Saprospiraceae bacterium]|jgi:TfoX/Sxy family transcriptional regulator of competence genes